MVRSLGDIYRQVEKIVESVPRGGLDIAKRLGKADNKRSTIIPRVPQPRQTPSIPSAPQRGIARGFAEVTREMRTMTPVEALAEVVNNPDITLTPKMVELINSPFTGMDADGEFRDIESIPNLNRSILAERNFQRQFSQASILPRKKRKVSKYQKEFGVQLKKLKKKHPRTKITALMTRAHAATRKKMGTKKGQVRKTARRAFKK
jgi:hypothetical protein